MPTRMGAIRNRLFGPDPRDVTFERRGFPPTTPERQANLEKVGTMFLAGFFPAMGARDLPELIGELDKIESGFQGFSFEGAAMALAVRDSLNPLGGRWIQRFLADRGDDHTYMVHVGVGWAMARVPRIRWRAIMPADPLLRWLALDGYGFHQTYFKTTRYVDQRYQSTLPVWRPSDYANRVVDQGIGRAMWFVQGSDPATVAAAFARFPAARHSDLWSGAGLAITYAGGVDETEIDKFAELSGPHIGDVRQACAFAAKARLRAGLVTPHTELAVKVLCGMSVEDAAAVTDETLAGLEPDGALPAFEVWRRRIKERLAAA